MNNFTVEISIRKLWRIVFSIGNEQEITVGTPEGRADGGTRSGGAFLEQENSYQFVIEKAP